MNRFISRIKELNARQILALYGALLLFSGTLLPMAKVPLSGRISLMAASGFHGKAILLLSTIITVAALRKWFRGLLPATLGSVAVLLSAYISARAGLLGGWGNRGWSDKMMQGFRASAMKNIHFELGLWVTLAGLFILLLATLPDKNYQRQQDSILR